MSSDQPETIELRRYPSRKLYNKSASRYVRLPEVAEMVRNGASIRVEDTESGEDVTRQVLLQIIMEQEAQPGGGMLSVDVLMDMVRFHQSRSADMMTGLFEQSVAFMRSQQEKFTSQVTSSLAQPWALFDPAHMQDVQREYQKQLAALLGGGVIPPSRAPTMSQEEPDDAHDELEALRRRLESLEARMSKKP